MGFFGPGVVVLLYLELSLNPAGGLMALSAVLRISSFKRDDDSRRLGLHSSARKQNKAKRRLYSSLRHIDAVTSSMEVERTNLYSKADLSKHMQNGTFR